MEDPAVAAKPNEAKGVKINKIPIATKDVQQSKDGMFHCPECNKPYPARKYLGRHRQSKHNIDGTSVSSVNKRQNIVVSVKEGIPITTQAVQPGKDGMFHCPECDKPYPSRSGLGVHRNYAHGITGTTYRPVHHMEKQKQGEIVHVNSSDFTSQPQLVNENLFESACAYHVGKFEAILGFYADANGLSKIELTHRVAELLLRASRR